MLSHSCTAYMGVYTAREVPPATGINWQWTSAQLEDSVHKYTHSDGASRLLSCTHTAGWTGCWWGPWALAGARLGQAGEKITQVAGVSACKYLWSPRWLCCRFLQWWQLLEYLWSGWLGTPVAPAMSLLLGAPAFLVLSHISQYLGFASLWVTWN